MLPGIPLFFRRGKELVLCVIVDHGLGQDLVIIMTLGGSEIIFHKGRDLIHVKIDIGNFIGFYIIKLSNFCKMLFIILFRFLSLHYHLCSLFI